MPELGVQRGQPGPPHRRRVGRGGEQLARTGATSASRPWRAADREHLHAVDAGAGRALVGGVLRQRLLRQRLGAGEVAGGEGEDRLEVASP